MSTTTTPNETIGRAHAMTRIQFDSTNRVGTFYIGSTMDTKIVAWHYKHAGEIVISWPNGDWSAESLHVFMERSPEPANYTTVENWSEIA